MTSNQMPSASGVRIAGDDYLRRSTAPFNWTFSEDDDVNAMRQAVRELTSKTHAAQRKGWHNPYLEAAVLEPPTP